MLHPHHNGIWTGGPGFARWQGEMGERGHQLRILDRGLLAVIHAQLVRATRPRVPVDHITQHLQSSELQVEKVKSHFAEMSSSDLGEILESSDNPVLEILRRYFDSSNERQ